MRQHHSHSWHPRPPQMLGPTPEVAWSLYRTHLPHDTGYTVHVRCVFVTLCSRRGERKVGTCSVLTQVFLSIFDPQVVNSANEEPWTQRADPVCFAGQPLPVYTGLQGALWALLCLALTRAWENWAGGGQRSWGTSLPQSLPSQGARSTTSQQKLQHFV